MQVNAVIPILTVKVPNICVSYDFKNVTERITDPGGPWIANFSLNTARYLCI